MQKITPFLWFADQAEQAVNYYVSVFKDARITDVVRYGPEGPGVAGTVMTIGFELHGEQFTALNGGPVYSFTPAISFVVRCKDQAEVDHLYEKLLMGGEEQQCGWLTDRFGVTWQIVPEVLLELMNDPDPEKVRRVTQAMYQMKKLEIQPLLDAAKQP